VRTCIAILAIVFILIPSTMLAGSVPRHSIGLSLFTGWETPSGLGWKSYDRWYDGRNTVFIPSYGWIVGKRWHIDLEGHIGCYHFEAKTGDQTVDTFTLGLAVMGAYDFLKFDRWAAYVDMGVGLSYWSDTPSPDYFDRNRLPGMIQYGAGAKIQIDESYFLKLAYRLAHTSGVFSDDQGINNHGLLIGIGKSF